MVKKISFFSFLLFLSFYIFADELFKDSIQVKQYNKTLYYNSDSIFINFANKGFLNVIDDYYDYLEDIFSHLPDNKKLSEIDKMKSLAIKYKNNELEKESEFLSIIILPDSTENQFFFKISKLKEIADKCENSNNILNLRILETIFDLYWNSTKYAKAFHQIHLIEKKLNSVTYDEYPDKGRMFFKIGEAYYFFRDYDKAIPYLRKALRPSKYYYDQSNLKARNTMGYCYTMKGNIDSADYYFRSAFNSHDVVKNRSIYDAVSLSNLGKGLIKRGRYDEAISYFEAGLARILIDNDYKLASDVNVGLTDCYLLKNDLKATKQLIDSSIYYIKQSKNQDLYQILYPIMCRYYIKVGNKKLANTYLDSTIIANERYFSKYSSQNILRAEQELFESETKAKDQQLQYTKSSYRNKIISASVIILLITVALLIFIILYRKNKKAYQALVIKNQDWAQSGTKFDSYEVTDNNSVILEEEFKKSSQEDYVLQKEDIELMKKVHELMINDKIFNDIDLTLDSLSKKLNINRNYLSKAVNKTTGKNFNTYVNEYRVKESIKIMSDKKSDVISVDAIALEVGFSNRTSFYQSFKKITGLSPSDFRNNRSKIDLTE